jgi:hypothetical protein
MPFVALKSVLVIFCFGLALKKYDEIDSCAPICSGNIDVSSKTIDGVL